MSEFAIWEIVTGRLISAINTDYVEGDTDPGDSDPVLFSPDGRILAIAGTANITLWQVGSGEKIQTINRYHQSWEVAWQLKQVCKYLPVRPISVRDSEYGCAPFGNIPADILVRLCSNLCLWGEPGAYSGIGRPKKYGDKFKLNEPIT
ncbi:hypothetical protein [Nostoc sp. C117]|uniref:hypothetical protein n=1 Tax=Nostoc sp. C117 TaxID=3349875 RepID=UPI00370D5AFB